MTSLARPQQKIFNVLFSAIFATIMGVGIVVPLLPVYAHQLGAGGFTIGMIFGAFSISRTILVSFFGRKSDQLGRKPFIVTGLLLYGMVSIAFIFFSSIPALIIIRFFQGIASAMLMPVILAYIGDITPPGSEGGVMGVFNMSTFLGLSIGPLMGGLINEHFSLNTAFAFMGALAFFSFLLCLLFLPPTHLEQNHGRKLAGAPWLELLNDHEICRLFVLRLAYATSVGIIWSFLPVWADAAFRLPSSLIGVLIMLGVFVSGIMHVPMGYLADRLNRKMLIAAGSLVVAISLFSFRWADGFWYLFTVNAGIGFGGGMLMPALMAMAVTRGDQLEVMGSIMGIIALAHSLGMLIGPLLAGMVMEAYPLGQVLSHACLVMIAGTAFFFLQPARSRP